MTAIISPIGDTSGVGAAIAETWNPLFPTYVPLETHQFFNDNGGDDIALQLANAIEGNVFAQGMQTDVPFDSAIASEFAELLPNGEMAFVDTSTVTTDEHWNDMKLENPIVASPWSNGAHLTFNEFDPLFAYRSDRAYTTPGFTTVATPPVINGIQAQLIKSEREAALYGETTSRETAARRQLAGAIGAEAYMAPVSNGGGLTLGAGGLMPISKRMRLFDVRAPHRGQQQVRRGGVDSQMLERLRRYAATTPEALYEMIDFLGPITQVVDGETTCASHVTFDNTQRNLAVRERVFNYSLYARCQIANIFGEKLHSGDGLYFTIAKFARDDLLRIKAAEHIFAQRGKRSYQEVNVSTFVGAASNTTDEFVQIRGWSSNDTNPYVGDSTHIGSMKPDVADRFYLEREVRAACMWKDYRWDDDNQKMIEVVENEGAQEALNRIPDLVIENFLSAGITIKVGTVKQKMNRATDTTSILNAHYNSVDLANQPTVEYYGNY